MNIKRILSKPIPVIWYRAKQALRLKILFKTGYWSRVSTAIASDSKVSSTETPSRLITTTGFSDAYKQYNVAQADAILSGTLSIYDVDYEFDFPLDWHTDWRAPYTYEKKYFKTYGFYSRSKTQEYDVKFPWEVSRLSFLIPVARAYRDTKEQKYAAFVSSTLQHWIDENPLAYSVNWYPMEVSCRTLNLVQLRDICISSKDTTSVTLLNTLLIQHGVFLWRNIEYTDVRGNHYAANLTALLALGFIYKDSYKESRKWLKYASTFIEKEFHLHFINDGVNFEKSTAYHRLVVELYMISFLLLDRHNLPVSQRTNDLLEQACCFTQSITKPDFITPIIGDNDSASVFQNDAVSLNDHRNLLQLASAYFNKQEFNLSDEVYQSAIEIFPVYAFAKAEPISNNTTLEHYKEGGFVIVKNKSDYLITDVGEVGMAGRGGHGHNDLYSFELMLDGHNLIVDPGCYTYTGDLEIKSLMKGTAYHNVVQIDDKEMAPILGEWGISNAATPVDVQVIDADKTITIAGSHAGYKRLESPVSLQRVFTVDKDNFNITIKDTITATGTHEVKRHFHFDKGVRIEVVNGGAVVTRGGKKYRLTYEKDSASTISDYILSYNYGSRKVASKLTVSTTVSTTIELQLTIQRLPDE